MGQIPRRMAFYWDGGQLSWNRYLTLRSFRHHNPDWEIVLYESQLPLPAKKGWDSHESMDHHEYHGPCYLSRIDELGVKTCRWVFGRPVNHLSAAPRSDLFTLEYLWHCGGYYADMDILFIKPMTAFENRIEAADLFWLHKIGEEQSYFPVYFLGAAPGMLFYRDLLNLAYADVAEATYQYLGLELWRRHRDKFALKLPAGKARRNFRYPAEAYPKLNIYSEPIMTVSPFHWYEVAEIFERRQTLLPNVTLGIHWYGGHPLSQQFNNTMTEDTWQSCQSTFSHFARQVLKC